MRYELERKPKCDNLREKEVEMVLYKPETKVKRNIKAKMFQISLSKSHMLVGEIAVICRPEQRNF